MDFGGQLGGGDSRSDGFEIFVVGGVVSFADRWEIK